MRLKITFGLLFFLLLHLGYSQGYSKLDLQLYHQLTTKDFSAKSELYPLVVKGNPSAIAALVKKYKGVYKFNVEDISSIAIPYNQLLDFSKEKAIVRIENTFAKGVQLLDTSRIRNNVDSAHKGIASLTQAYKGKGVVVGIIDGSFWYKHGDFRDSAGNTRVAYFWDQGLSGSAPAPFSYGTEWNSAAIDAGSCTHVPLVSDFGHGTCVAGIAAGNGLSHKGNATYDKTYVGIAPEADIVFVRLDYTRPNFESDVLDAVQYIYTKAAAMGKPCVINTSVGTYYGSRDGNDLYAQAIANLIKAQNGRSLVAAAGNARAYKYHLSYPFSNTDSLFTWFQYNSSTGNIYFDFWADATQMTNLAKFKVGCNTAAGVNVGQTRYYDLPTDFIPYGSGYIKYDTIRNSANTIVGVLLMAVEQVAGTYHLEFLITPKNVNPTTNLWRLQTNGVGQFDLWASKAVIGTADMKITSPAVSTLLNYRFPDTLKSIVSSWQCTPEVLTVGNYTNRYSYTTMLGTTQVEGAAPEAVGKIYSSSSIGPTRDGRIKPEIMATGSTTLCSGDSVYIQNLISASQQFKIAAGGKHVRNGGTSMASPHVAGIVALLLQKNPNLSYQDIKNVIIATANKDAFTTNVIPNNSYGYGKINAYQALLEVGKYTWNGTVSSDWENPLNWTPNGVPNNCAVDAIIPSGTAFAPTISSNNISINNLTIAENTTLTLNAKDISLCGNWTGGSTQNALVAGTGKVIMNATVAQTIANKTTFKTLAINNNSGVSNTGAVQIDSIFIPQKGVYNSNNATTFLSTSDIHCATIDFSATNTGSINGNVIAQRFVPVAGLNQHLIASPINTIAFSQWNASGIAGYIISDSCDELVSTTGSPYGKVFQYHEDHAAGCALKGWEVKLSGSADNARGYSVYLNGNQTLNETGAANQLSSYTVSGLSNTGWATNYSKQGRPMNAGWNLAGNPYLSVINLSTKADFDAQVQVWKTSGPFSGTYQPILMGIDAVIAPFQGFMVHKTAVGTSSFTINKTECVNNIPTKFYKQTGNEFTVTISNQFNNQDITKIIFNADATENFDPMIDANKPFGKINQPTIYTKIADNGFAINNIQSVAQTPALPLYLYPGVNSNCTFSFDFSKLENNINVFLEDKKMGGNWIDTKANPTYTFYANTSDDWDRFVLHFDTVATVNTGIQSTANTTKIYSYLHKIIIEKNNADLANVTVYDMLGAQVLSSTINKSYNVIETNLPIGIYVVKINTNTLQQSGKVLLKD